MIPPKAKLSVLADIIKFFTGFIVMYNQISRFYFILNRMLAVKVMHPSHIGPLSATPKHILIHISPL